MKYADKLVADNVMDIIISSGTKKFKYNRMKELSHYKYILVRRTYRREKIQNP